MTTLNEKKEGERVVGFFIIKDRVLKVAANGSEYLDFVLVDRKTTITAKLWDITAQQKEILQKKAVVKVEGIVHFYRNQKQLNIQRIRLAVEDDPVKLVDLIPHANVSREELWHDLRLFIDEIESPQLAQIIKRLFGDKNVRDLVTTIPAGKKLHHAYYAGLLEHIVTLCHGAVQLLSLYPFVNKDHVLATCMLHDIGKIKELSDPIAPEYTTEGELMGHIILGIEMINDAARELGFASDDPDIAAVKHCILSHHGDVDWGWGSAVSGKTPAAVFFHYLDQIDAKMNAMQAVNESGADEWNYSPMLKRRIYKG
ncbi:3'-5' exoribonuclease YhaM family protein [Desertibacillus haloalkaliphilus]|uniref:3'-5' exoribonuclease YhaM family protein n=1 Tax=Desertibacillus haloalkaliphilus TaxID=1328930 RepID=UPI001FECAD80|nr:HD domain-containing protein [Desertibacillus haloalkaliphilus]